jgi:hypothetical protein
MAIYARRLQFKTWLAGPQNLGGIEVTVTLEMAPGAPPETPVRIPLSEHDRVANHVAAAIDTALRELERLGVKTIAPASTPDSILQ